MSDKGHVFDLGFKLEPATVRPRLYLLCPSFIPRLLAYPIAMSSDDQYFLDIVRIQQQVRLLK